MPRRPNKGRVQSRPTRIRSKKIMHADPVDQPPLRTPGKEPQRKAKYPDINATPFSESAFPLPTAIRPAGQRSFGRFLEPIRYFELINKGAGHLAVVCGTSRAFERSEKDAAAQYSVHGPYHPEEFEDVKNALEAHVMEATNYYRCGAVIKTNPGGSDKLRERTAALGALMLFMGKGFVRDPGLQLPISLAETTAYDYAPYDTVHVYRKVDEASTGAMVRFTPPEENMISFAACAIPAGKPADLDIADRLTRSDMPRGVWEPNITSFAVTGKEFPLNQLSLLIASTTIMRYEAVKGL